VDISNLSQVNTRSSGKYSTWVLASTVILGSEFHGTTVTPVGRPMRLLFFPRIFSIFYDTDRIENIVSNRSFNVACAFVAAGTYLLSRCLTMAVSSGCIIPAFSH
jgi:hypothetical protein